MAEELKNNDIENDSEINKINVNEVSEQIATNNDEGNNINNETLMKEFDEYFKNNITNEERNELNSLNIDNIKELKSDEINKLPFILNKEQFYQSFVLFQKYLYWNIHKNYFQNLKKSNNNICQNQQSSNIKNSQKSNNEILKKENDDKITLDENKEKKSNFSLNNNNKENKIKNSKNYSETLSNKNYKINNYDERPIKTSHKNFLELLENSIRKKNREFFVQIFQRKIRIIKGKKVLKKRPANSIDYSILKNEKKNINKINKYYSYDNILSKKYKKNIFDCIQTQRSIKNKDIQEFKSNTNTNTNLKVNDDIKYNNNKENKSINKNSNNDNQEKKGITENENNIVQKKDIKNQVPPLARNVNEIKNENDSNKNELNTKVNNNKIANRQYIIQQKIQELNEEISNFREERNKIQKLKEEYEKLQSKLIEDIQEFNDKKEEFEKYRLNEMNKIMQDKIKYTTVNRNFNDIKMNYHNMVLCSEKDKEIIKNLKNQINELKNIIKSKPPNSTTKKNIFQKNKKYKTSNNLLVKTNNNSDTDGKNKEEEKEKNEIFFMDNNKKDNKFETISDELKKREKNYSSFGSKKIKKMKSNSKNNENKIKKKLNEKGKNFYNDMYDYENIKIFNKSIKSTNNNENDKKKINIINTIESVKTENNFINLNINANTLENNGFYFRENKSLKNKNNNNTISKKSNCKLTNNKYGITKYSSYFEEIKKNNNIIINNNRKNKFDNLEKEIENHNIFKNNQNAYINSLFNKRKQIKKLGINNLKNSKLTRTYKQTKNFKTKPIINSSPYKNYAFSREKNNKENINNKDIHQNLSNKKFKTNIKLSLSNSSSTKNKNTKKFMETKKMASSMSNKKKHSDKNNLIKQEHKLKKLNKNCTNSISEKKILKNKNKIHPNLNEYDFIIPEKYLNIDYKLIRSLTSKGKIIKLYNHNKKEIIFKSGVIKETFGDGFQIVYFTNGDKKQIYPGRKMVYYFHDSKTVQTKFSNGLQICKLNNGQIEKHFPDKTKKIYFPDGSERFIKNDENEELQNNYGTILTIDKSGIITSKTNE